MQGAHSSIRPAVQRRRHSPVTLRGGLRGPRCRRCKEFLPGDLRHCHPHDAGERRQPPGPPANDVGQYLLIAIFQSTGPLYGENIRISIQEH